MKRGTIDHPKMLKLAAALKIPRYSAVGLFECLLHFAAKYVLLGDIGKYGCGEIANAVFWRGDAVKLLAAFTWARLVDLDDGCRLLIHDWQDHCDESVKKTIANRGQVFILPKSRIILELSGTFETFFPAFALALALPLPEPLPKPLTDSPDLGKPVRARILFDGASQSFQGITPADLEEWVDAYPATKPDLELKRMKQWLKSNPKKAIKRNWLRFITNWLARTQDQGGTKGTHDGKPETSRPAGRTYKASHRVEA
jgi:hypothetical protein